MQPIQPIPTSHALLQSWSLSLRAEAKSPKTVENYLHALRQFESFRIEQQMVGGLHQASRAEIRAFLDHLLATSKPATARNRFAAMPVFHKWLVEEQEIETSPMQSVKAPRVPIEPPPVLADVELKKLLDSVSGSDLAARRDTAIIRLFIDCGLRRSELAQLQLDDVDLADQIVLVIGKGNRRRAVPFGAKTAKAIDRYLRIRATVNQSESSWLWVGTTGRGRLLSDGIYQMIQRRGREAGLHFHPHQLRHTMAHRWLTDGGSEGDLMRLAGW